MAWDPIGNDEWTGDVPFDAFSAALRKAAAHFGEGANRKPYAAELARAMAQAIAARHESVRDAARAPDLLAQWLALPRVESAPRPEVRAGDVLRIPWTSGGRAQVYGWVRSTAPRGMQLVVYDLDVPPDGDLGETDLDRTRLMFGAVDVGDEAVKDGRWTIAFNTSAHGPHNLVSGAGRVSPEHVVTLVRMLRGDAALLVPYVDGMQLDYEALKRNSGRVI